MWKTYRKPTLKIQAILALSFLLLVTSARGLAPTMEFDPTLNGIVNNIAIQDDGKIIIGGNFSKVNGNTVRLLARLNSDSSLQNFAPQPNSSLSSLQILANGQILIGGYSILSAGPAASFEMDLPDSTPMAQWTPALTLI